MIDKCTIVIINYAIDNNIAYRWGSLCFKIFKYWNLKVNNVINQGNKTNLSNLKTKLFYQKV